MSVSTSYAKALYEAGKEQSFSSADFEKLENDLDIVHGFISSSKQVKTALLSPLTSLREKQEALAGIGEKLQFSPLLNQFIGLLVKKARLGLIQQIRDDFSAVRLMSEGGVSGTLVAADPMTDADLGVLTKAFGQKFGKKVAFRISIDPSLLAGMKVTVNGVTYDGTLRSQIQRLRDQLVSGAPGAQA